jgi:hypothetical protein
MQIILQIQQVTIDNSNDAIERYLHMNVDGYVHSDFHFSPHVNINLIVHGTHIGWVSF